jgi:hypothetical protein
MLRYRQIRFVLLLAALVVASATAQASDVRDTVKKSFKVRSGGTLYIDIDQGNVEVESVRGDLVRIEIIRSVDVDDRDEAKSIFARHDLSIEQDGNNVSIESRFDQSSNRWRLPRGRERVRIEVRVQVPQHFNVDFSSGVGNVAIGSVRGEVKGRTGAGNIDIGAVDGVVSVASGSGNVQLRGASGRVEARTGAGNVELRDVKGEIDVNTGAGNIAAAITQQPRGESRLASGAGNVTVYLSDRVGVYVSAEASVGSATNDFSLPVEGKWMRKSFEGRINGGGPGLRIRTGVGNVMVKRR